MRERERWLVGGQVNVERQKSLGRWVKVEVVGIASGSMKRECG